MLGGRSNILSVATAALAIFSTSVDARPRGKKLDDNHWVAAWTSMPQLVESNNMPPSQFTNGGVFKDATLRQTLYMTLNAEKIKIAISNTFGGSDLPITAASVGLPTGEKAGVSGIQESPLVGVTFNGKASVTVPKGQVVVSDEIAFPIKAQQNIAVSLYSQAGQSGSSITGHPGSRTTSWMQSGNKVNSTTMSGSSTNHWYFVSAVHASVPTTTRSLIILGDSITDGRGSDDNGNNRWPDLLLAKFQTSNITNIGIGNQAAGGNRVLADGLGPSLISRYTRDAITQPGTKWVMVFEGVNDIGSAGTSSQVQQQIGDQLIRAFTQIAGDAKKAGLITIGATITPFSGSGQSYSDPTREKTRQRVNQWIQTSGTFDHVVDFAKVVANPNTPSQLDSKYDGSGDHLHPNVAGYRAMADTVPLDIFKA
jgi:lysophospholipase L1-like esterase